MFLQSLLRTYLVYISSNISRLLLRSYDLLLTLQFRKHCSKILLRFERVLPNVGTIYQVPDSIGKITFQTRSLLTKVLPFTFLLYALDTLSFCLFIISSARSLSSSKSTNSFIINSQYTLGGMSACLCILTDCKHISIGSTASCPNVNWKGVVFVASFGDVRQAQSA